MQACARENKALCMGQRDQHVVHEHAGAGAGARNGRLGAAHGESCRSCENQPLPLDLDLTVCLLLSELQIEQRMAAKILEEEEKRMFHEMNEQERLKAEQRCVGGKGERRGGAAEKAWLGVESGSVGMRQLRDRGESTQERKVIYLKEEGSKQGREGRGEARGN